MQAPCRPHAGPMQAPCRPHAGPMHGPCAPHAGPCTPHAGPMQAPCTPMYDTTPMHPHVWCARSWVAGITVFLGMAALAGIAPRLLGPDTAGHTAALLSFVGVLLLTHAATVFYASLRPGVCGLHGGTSERVDGVGWSGRGVCALSP
jgi:hypothetical protein